MAMTDKNKEELKVVLDKLIKKLLPTIEEISKIYNVSLKLKVEWEFEDRDDDGRSTDSTG